MRPVRSGQQVADIAKISYAGFGGTAEHASVGMWVGFTRENMPPRAWSTRGCGRAATDTLAQAIPNRTRCSSHAIGRRVSPASFFAVSSSGWRSRRMVFTTSGARRQSILQAKLSVKKAAEMLGVGRPALSNLLNGRAALSPDMAMRFEKAFQADASALLEMQARYDELEARAGEDDIVVRAYAPAYLEITARQIAAWADTIDAREQLPALLRTLVHSTGSNLTAVDFPAFDNSQRRGWDGQVTSGSATPWIPRGQSGWEFGCNKNPETKAETDYQTRTASVPSKERKSRTFVFVTPRNDAHPRVWPRRYRRRDDRSTAFPLLARRRRCLAV